MKKKVKKTEKEEISPLLFLLALVLPLLGLLTPAITIAQEDVDNKAEEIREAVEKKVQETTNKLNLNEKVGFSGNLIKTTDNTLTLKSDTKEYLINVAADAAILNSKRKETTIENLELDKPIIALGYNEADGEILAKRIVQINKLNKTEKEAVFGIVTDISRDEEVLTIKNPVKEETYLIDASQVEKITKNGAGGIESAVYTEINENSKIIAIGTIAENGQKSLKATRIHILEIASQ